MTMITPSYLGETIEYSSLHACRSTLEDPTDISVLRNRFEPRCLGKVSTLRPRGRSHERRRWKYRVTTLSVLS